MFDRMEYHFEVDFRMHQVPNAFLEMLDIHDHLPQALVLMVGTNDIGVATKVQARARAEDMLTRHYGNVGKSETHINVLSGFVCVLAAATVVVYWFSPAEGGEGS